MTYNFIVLFLVVFLIIFGLFFVKTMSGYNKLLSVCFFAKLPFTNAQFLKKIGHGNNLKYRILCKKTTPKQPQNNPKTTPNKDVNVNVNNKETISKDIVKKNSRFSPPSIEDVEKYILEKKYNVSAEAFHAFYESNGWYVGSHKMKDWHKAITTWHCRNRGEYKNDNLNVNDLWT